MPTRDVAAMLMAAYQIEVENRDRVFCADKNIMGCISAVAQFLTCDSEKNSLMLLGTCGNGKTTMLHAMQLVINYTNEQRYTTLKPGLCIKDAKELSLSTKTNHDILRAIRDEELLAIDDMGREPTERQEYGNIYTPVIDLLEYRYDRQLPTIIATNLKKGEVRSKYGNRIADRLNEMMQCVVFTHETYRR